jgi:hypothetical protein
MVSVESLDHRFFGQTTLLRSRAPGVEPAPGERIDRRRADTRSSQTITSGSSINARAMLTR